MFQLGRLQDAGDRPTRSVSNISAVVSGLQMYRLQRFRKTVLSRRLPEKMPTKPIDGTVQRGVVLAKAEACKVARRASRIVVEGTDRHGGHTGFDRDMAAEILVGAVEAERAKVGRHEISAGRRQDLEADVGQGIAQPVAL